MDANVLVRTQSHRDYTNYYMFVDDGSDIVGHLAWRVLIKHMENRTATCDTCGERPAEYWLDATLDLGTAAVNAGQCQHCLDWAYNNQEEHGDVFHEHRWVDASRADLIAMLLEQGWNHTQFSVMDDEDLRAEVMPFDAYGGDAE